MGDRSLGPVLAWQSNLFGDAAPRADANPIERVELAGGAWLDWAPGWLAGSDTLLQELLDAAPWGQRQRYMYEGMVDEPRLTAGWSAQRGWDGVPSAVLDVRDRMSERYALDFDSVHCNLYRDGSDSVAWHGDTVRRSIQEPVVVILSLGQRRRFLLRPVGGGRSRRYDLGDGDLLVMGGTSQHSWQHCVPKVRQAGARISVTLRHSRPAVDPAVSAGGAPAAAPATA
jgi:alkylated DNA repair dioxygenase AlkB